MSGRPLSDLPFQQAPDVVSLALADYELLFVAKSQHPAMAGKGGDLADVIDIHDGVAMHTLEREGLKAGLQCAQSLAGHEAAFGRNDPNQLALGLQRQHFIGIQQIVLAAGAAH